MNCSVAFRDTSYMAISNGNPADSGNLVLQKFEYNTVAVERLAIFGPLVPILPRVYHYSDSFKISKIDSCPDVEVENKPEKFHGKMEEDKTCVYGFIPDLVSKYRVLFKDYTDEINFVKISSWAYCPFCTM